MGRTGEIMRLLFRPQHHFTMDKRRQILEAADRVFRSKGLAKATTREIARDAGCADGTLYLHFDDRLSLFSAVLDECVPDVKESLQQLETLVGKRSVQLNLEMVADRYIAFYQRVLGAVCSIFAEPELLEAHRQKMREQGKGPHISETMLADYIRAEQKTGRIDRRAAPEAITSMLIGGCLYRVFISRYLGDEMQPAPHVFARKLVDNILRGARTNALASAPEPEFSCVD
jgi:AcrR family transcriptional regulator